MEEQTSIVLKNAEEERAKNNETVGLADEDGPIRYLNMDADDFNRMTVEELYNASAALNCLSFQVQRFQSDNEAASNRLERHINKAAAQTSSQYEGFSFEERKLKAICGSKVLAELDTEQSKFKQKSLQYNFLAMSINKLADTLVKKADFKNRRVYNG